MAEAKKDPSWINASEFIAKEYIRKIQLDAMKEGARRAAFEVQKSFRHIASPIIQEAIFTASTQWKESDL